MSQSHWHRGVSPDIPRDEWVKIGMAIKSEFPYAFELFDDWSKTGRTYNSKDSRATWKSIKPEGGITIKSLFFTAQKQGFVCNEYTHDQ